MIRKCKVCGCTFDNPCFNYRWGFCWWPSSTEDICSHCTNQVVPLKDDPYTIHCVNGTEYPVLTVHQPWATMLVEGLKEFEYRSWKLQERYVGQRIFIHASRKFAEFDPQFGDERGFFDCMNKTERGNLQSAIIGSVIFGESQGPVDGVVDGQPKLLYKWPVLEPVRLIRPLFRISGKQGIWKIKF